MSDSQVIDKSIVDAEQDIVKSEFATGVSMLTFRMEKGGKARPQYKLSADSDGVKIGPLISENGSATYDFKLDYPLNTLREGTLLRFGVDISGAKDKWLNDFNFKVGLESNKTLELVLESSGLSTYVVDNIL